MSAVSDNMVMARMGVDELERVKGRITDGFRASPGSDLAAMMAEMIASLERSPLLRAATARKTGGRAHLIEVQCHRATPDLAPDTIMAEIERLWLEELRYDDFEAHTIELTDEHGILDFVTVTRDQRLYLSGMIVAHFGPNHE